MARYECLNITYLCAISIRGIESAEVPYLPNDISVIKELTATTLPKREGRCSEGMPATGKTLRHAWLVDTVADHVDHYRTFGCFSALSDQSRSIPPETRHIGRRQSPGFHLGSGTESLARLKGLLFAGNDRRAAS